MSRKSNSGVGRSALKQVSRQMKQDAARGVISISAITSKTKKMHTRDSNAVYELLDKHYPMIKGYRFEDLGIGGYNYFKRRENGSWYRVNSWHQPYPDSLTTASAKRGFVKLQIYGDAGKVER